MCPKATHASKFMRGRFSYAILMIVFNLSSILFFIVHPVAGARLSTKNTPQFYAMDLQRRQIPSKSIAALSRKPELNQSISNDNKSPERKLTPVPACPGSPPGVLSLLSSAINVGAETGIQCRNLTKPRNQTSTASGVSRNQTSTSSGVMKAEDCICAFNLIQQAIFNHQFNTTTDKSNVTTKSTKVSQPHNKEVFEKSCPLAPVQNPQQCDKQRDNNTECASVTSNTARGIVKTCTVKINANGESDLSSSPVQLALTDLSFGFRSYAWSCCPLNGFELSVNDLPGARRVNDSLVVTGTPTK